MSSKDPRAKILKIYNKRLEDFPSLKEYNDYLEHTEDIIYKLTNKISESDIMKEINEYQAKNIDLISRNNAKKEELKRQVEQRIEQEAREQKRRIQEIQESKEKPKENQTITTNFQVPVVKKPLITQTPGGPPPKTSFPTNFSRPGLPTTMPTPLGMRVQSISLMTPQVNQSGVNTVTSTPSLTRPTRKLSLSAIQLTTEPDAIAGGYSIEFPRKRGLQEAFDAMGI